MQQTRAVELGTGLFVFMGILALFFLTTRVTSFDAYAGDGGYELTARFDQIGTLKTRSPVSISGVQIGRVTAIDFDVERLEAGVNGTARWYPPRAVPAATAGSVALLLLGVGLLNTFLAVQAAAMGWAPLVIGGVMSAYFIGYGCGTFATSFLIRRTGHIRAFAVFAALASCTVIGHALTDAAWAWALLRVLVLRLLRDGRGGGDGPAVAGAPDDHLRRLLRRGADVGGGRGQWRHLQGGGGRPRGLGRGCG